jgi:hypothetical protein
MAQATKTRSPGKSAFLKEFLHDNPKANAKAVNAAWKSAGMEGSISDSLVSNLRSKLGLSGNQRAKAVKTGRKPTASEKTSQTNSRSRQLADLESDVDRLIFKAMQIGGLAEIEASLRATRRLLYKALG